MLKRIMKLLCCLVFLFSFTTQSWASEMDVLVNKLVEKNVLTPYEGQILKAQAKEEAAMELAQGKAVTAPKWTQKIKLKGDVRFRTQVEWGKSLAPAHERIRQRVRARVGLEGTVNDQVKGGVLLVTGGNDPRSTNETLDDGFATQDARLDAYYIKWTPKFYDTKKYGRSTLWLGKFKNPFKKTALLWDGDINPTGTAYQYKSPTFEFLGLSHNAYGNFGFLWLDELGRFQNDPLMFVYQGGIKTDLIPDWDATLDFATAFYCTSHVKGNGNGVGYVGTAGTNSYDGNGAYATDFNMVDFILNYDSKSLFGYGLGNGVYADFILNLDNAAESTGDYAWMIGAYLGKKKPKKPGQWKIYGEYRYIRQNAVPDFLPDSDFVGYTTAGVPAGGGTNARGFVGGVKYALFKNTVLGVKYYYTTPIDIGLSTPNAYREPYQLLQMDVAVKF